MDNSRTIPIDQSDPDTTLTNGNPTGLAVYNDILYCLDGEQFDGQLFSYSFDTKQQLGSPLNFAQVEGNDLIGLRGLAIDPDGTTYVASPGYLERQPNGRYENKPTLWIYSNPSQTSPTGQAITIDKWVTGLATTNDWVLTVSNDTDNNKKYCTVYDKTTKLPLVDRGFALDGANNNPAGCHVVGNVLFVVDQRARTDRLFAYSLNYRTFDKALEIINSISSYSLKKSMQIINSIETYPLKKQLEILNRIFQKRIFDKRLTIINVIQEYSLTKQLEITNKITSALLASELKIINAIRNYRTRFTIKLFYGKKRQ